LAPQPEVEKAVAGFSDYIKTQVLADVIQVEQNDGQEVDFDEFKLNIKVDKI
jgi:isoleucyl-tRNA synthetase